MIADLSCPIIWLHIHDAMNEYQIGFREVRASIRCDDVCLPMMLEDQNCYRCLMCHATEIMEFLWERNYQLNEWDVMILLLTSQKLGLKVMQLCLVKTFRGNSLDFFLSRIHALDHDLLSSFIHNPIFNPSSS